ncbi:hypothetical protein FHG87_008995 [Trinorchestia longiramus]|nr:hypothetical protein FHG87_008995 [Trinorchestia longiramus]
MSLPVPACPCLSLPVPACPKIFPHTIDCLTAAAPRQLVQLPGSWCSWSLYSQYTTVHKLNIALLTLMRTITGRQKRCSMFVTSPTLKNYATVKKDGRPDCAGLRGWRLTAVLLVVVVQQPAVRGSYVLQLSGDSNHVLTVLPGVSSSYVLGRSYRSPDVSHQAAECLEVTSYFTSPPLPHAPILITLASVPHRSCFLTLHPPAHLGVQVVQHAPSSSADPRFFRLQEGDAGGVRLVHHASGLVVTHAGGTLALVPPPTTPPAPLDFEFDFLPCTDS